MSIKTGSDHQQIRECPFCGVEGKPFGKGSYSFMHKPKCFLNDGSLPRVVYTEQVESWNTRYNPNEVRTSAKEMI